MTVNQLAIQALLRQPCGRRLEVSDLTFLGNDVVARTTVPGIVEFQSGVPGGTIGASQAIKVLTRMAVSQERMRKQDSGVPAIHGANKRSRQSDAPDSGDRNFAPITNRIECDRDISENLTHCTDVKL